MFLCPHRQETRRLPRKLLRGVQLEEPREPFLRDAVVLAVEARTEVELRESLVGDARRWAADGEAARQVLVTLGKLFPAFGLIGTLLGLAHRRAIADDERCCGAGTRRSGAGDDGR